jgi:uncharacterized DUF497 family protein
MFIPKPVFDWDDANIAHIARHNITPAEAEAVLLADPYDLDYQVRNGEERVEQIGATGAGRILAVVTTVRRGKTRVVTAYPATKRQQAVYFNARGI